ncbi:hypothetical protein ACFL41_01790, partial [Gemmatimonadota bacterium]
RSSIPVEESVRDGRVVCRLIRDRVHLTSLNLVYTLGPVMLKIEKAINPSEITQSGQVEVSYTIENIGREDAREVNLQDSFDPRDFSGSGEEFELYADEGVDRRLMWSRSIETIQAGESATVTLSLRALRAVHSVSLSAAIATIGDELVGISNKVRLPDY